MSQRDRILKALLAGETLTPIDCLNRFGCFRAASRIDELRKEGYAIETQINQKGKRYAKYYLRKPAIQFAE